MRKWKSCSIRLFCADWRDVGSLSVNVKTKNMVRLTDHVGDDIDEMHVRLPPCEASILGKTLFYFSANSELCLLTAEKWTSHTILSDITHIVFVLLHNNVSSWSMPSPLYVGKIEMHLVNFSAVLVNGKSIGYFTPPHRPPHLQFYKCDEKFYKLQTRTLFDCAQIEIQQQHRKNQKMNDETVPNLVNLSIINFLSMLDNRAQRAP